jgi:ribonuclease HI
VYALQAWKRITAFHQREPGMRIELRWWPAHKGVPENGKADEWAKLAVDEPHSHGVEFPRFGNR